MSNADEHGRDASGPTQPGQQPEQQSGSSTSPFGGAPAGPHFESGSSQTPQQPAPEYQTPLPSAQPYASTSYDQAQYGSAQYDPNQYGSNPYASASYGSDPYAASQQTVPQQTASQQAASQQAGAEQTAPLYTGADFPAPAGVPPVAESYAPVALAKKPRGRLAALLVAASLSALIGAGAGIGGYEYATGNSSSSSSSVSPISVTTVPAAQTPVLDGTISAAASKIQPSVVTITVASGQTGDIGTGVVLDTSGHILTNNHVVEAAAKTGTISVAFHNGKTAKATIVGTSVTNDLAVIKVDGVSDLTPAVFAKSSSIKVGQSVVAAGAPLGLSETITSGIVSNTARPVRSGSNDDAVYLAVQTDTAINPGNSGGPLVDLDGAVVGINSSIASTGSTDSTSTQSGSIGIGFAIPADVAVRVAGELIADGTSTNAALGVTVAGTDSSSTTATVSTGVPLQTVVSGKAADQAGLKAGDVVTDVDGFATTTSDGLIAATRFYAPGTKISVTYTRSGSTHTVDVTLGSS